MVKPGQLLLNVQLTPLPEVLVLLIAVIEALPP